MTLSEPLPPKPEPLRRPAKAAGMLALAHHLQGTIDRGLVADRAAVGAQARAHPGAVTQPLDLLLYLSASAARVCERRQLRSSDPSPLHSAKPAIDSFSLPRREVAPASLWIRGR